MTSLSPMERVHELIGLLDLHPTLEQIAGFMSNSIDPFGEICGVSIGKLDGQGSISIEFLIGFKQQLDYTSKVAISDHNPGAIALRTGQLQLISLDPRTLEHRDIQQMKNLLDYKSGAALPLTDSVIMGFGFTAPLSDMELYRDYFEVVRTVVAHYLAKGKLASKKNAHFQSGLKDELTNRQTAILDMIKEGRTNHSIAAILGYSESLIRQETIIIYRKLGVEGRRELLNKTNIEKHSE